MASKLKLNPEPTFKSKVYIPVHGAKDAEVEFTFKHRPTEEMAEWLKALEGRDKVEVVMEATLGWDLTDQFTPENMKVLLSNYGSSFDRILAKYTEEMIQVRQKN